MAVSFTLTGLTCPKMRTYVSLDLSEAECRKLHNCTETGPCPLAAELGRDPMERTLTALGEDWLTQAA